MRFSLLSLLAISCFVGCGDESGDDKPESMPAAEDCGDGFERMDGGHSQCLEHLSPFKTELRQAAHVGH